jgi:uncharacterized protein YbjT (DUF2867 family)
VKPPLTPTAKEGKDIIMKIVVIGGNGQVGSRLVPELEAAGHEVVSASRSTGVDAVTGEGLDAALTGAQVVVDVLGAPTWDQEELLRFFRDSARTLVAAEARAGVGHHVVLSIVGMDRTDRPGPYISAKLAQEDEVRKGGVPYTIARATQFFEFLAFIGEAAGYRLPPAPMQPIAVDDVAALLAEIAVGPPADGIVDLAGPERGIMDELVRRVSGHEVTTDPEADYFGTPWSDDLLVPIPGDGDVRLGATTLEQWLAAAHDRA